jgi:hypothetical protein
MNKCKILGCNQTKIEGELFLGEEFDKKYWGYCLEHAKARKEEDERLVKLDALEKEKEEENDI